MMEAQRIFRDSCKNPHLVLRYMRGRGVGGEWVGNGFRLYAFEDGSGFIWTETGAGAVYMEVCEDWLRQQHEAAEALRHSLATEKPDTVDLYTRLRNSERAGELVMVTGFAGDKIKGGEGTTWTVLHAIKHAADANVDLFLTSDVCRHFFNTDYGGP